MTDYSKFISEKRRSVPTPDSLVTSDGKAVFGTFDKEFKEMDLVKLNKPTKAPNCMNKLKLTLWEAAEVNLKNGILLFAVSDMAIFGKIIVVFFDKRTKQVYTWDESIPSKAAVICPNLLNGSITEGTSETNHAKFVNDFQDGKARISAELKGKCIVNNDLKNKREDCSLIFDFDLTRLSKPCVVSIPFPYSDNRPLYSQKDFFKAVGKLVINGEEMLTDEYSTAIIDDHRGFYPRKAHYDWVTTMGKCNVDGVEKYLAFNLTRNQSINQEDYNENLIWFEGDTSLLPPVTFTRSVETKDFEFGKECVWTVKDEHDMVNLKFKVYNINARVMHALVVNIDYYITFGELEGYLRDEAGNKYTLDGMIGIGEDKSLLL